MSKVLANLIDKISLEQLDNNLFRGEVLDDAYGMVYGGQVLAQSIHAAHMTVSSRYALHSIHTYFLRPGDTEKPIIYEVDRIRDGKHFTTRRVVAIQHGRAIFNASLSFHLPEKGATKLKRQDVMPDVPEPKSLLSDENYYREIYTGDRVLPSAWPIEYRQVEPMAAGEKMPGVHYVWFRADGHIAKDGSQHQELLAYASYGRMILSALRPFGLTPWERNIQAVALDQSIWFHRPFRIDDWLLGEFHCPSAATKRTFTQGKIYNNHKQLVASVSQEGSVRFNS